MSWRWKSIGAEASITPLIPPIRNMLTMPIANSMAVVNVIEPRHRVASQLNIFTPVGIAIRAVMKVKNGRNTTPVVNMWCAQTLNESRPMAMVAHAKARYPNSGLRREDRQDLAHHPERGQDDDVDLRVAEEPEQVLPQDRVAADRWGRRTSRRSCGR